MLAIRGVVICKTNGKHVVQVDAHQGADLCRFLADHGVDSTVVRDLETRSEVLEFDDDIHVAEIQDILDGWQ